MVALDSMAMTYWIQALSSVPGPPPDPLSTEKIALARIFFWLPSGCGFNLTPTVQREYEDIKSAQNRSQHISWAFAHLSPVMPAPEIAAVNARASALRNFHNEEKDCRIVAECELSGIQTLLTTDRNLLNRLGTHAKGIDLRRPTDYWIAMAVPKGQRPNIIPTSGNSLATCSWWHW